MPRSGTIIVLGFVVMMIALIVAWPYLDHYQRTGRLAPIDMIESLVSPVSVRDWDATGLNLADGRHIQLPDISNLPTESAALSEATKRGVEIAEDGRVYGLVQLHHWCGNDPVREHIVQVDLSCMLTFVREGKSTLPPALPGFLAEETGGEFSEWGWRVSEFYEFQGFCAYIRYQGFPVDTDKQSD